MKVCAKCSLPKDESEFSWSILGIKKHSRCKKCRAEDRMDYYEDHKDQELKYKWGRQQRKRVEAKEYVDNYKATHPCVDCGKSDPRLLTFDHVRDIKKMAISQMVNQGYSLEAIQTEIDKCEVRCLECHHIRHHG
jgi:hypothetical protein